jgi:hypothetical protein
MGGIDTPDRDPEAEALRSKQREENAKRVIKVVTELQLLDQEICAYDLQIEDKRNRRRVLWQNLLDFTNVGKP